MRCQEIGRHNKKNDIYNKMIIQKVTRREKSSDHCMITSIDSALLEAHLYLKQCNKELHRACLK
jgi:hypothetical protein